MNRPEVLLELIFNPNPRLGFYDSLPNGGLSGKKSNVVK
jgi:hypothetical protein